MKRSQSVTRVLLSGLSVGALTAWTPTAPAAERASGERYYANDDQIPGAAGFYHAPFRAFYALPYNYYDADRKMYFSGGQWGAVPHRSIVNISSPAPGAVPAVVPMSTTHYQRNGFGSTSRSHLIPS